VFLPWVAVPGYGINMIQVLDITNELRRLGLEPTIQIGEYTITAVVFLAACLVLLVLGSIASFLRPWGGVLVLLSWLMFAVGFYLFLPSIARILVGFGVGFYLAVVSSVISLARYALRPRSEQHTWQQAQPAVGASWQQYPPPPQH